MKSDARETSTSCTTYAFRAGAVETRFRNRENCTPATICANSAGCASLALQPREHEIDCFYGWGRRLFMAS
jgi:TPP-dependent indolepyruvate ferredoxin oxidoreductase alpha subunit